MTKIKVKGTEEKIKLKSSNLMLEIKKLKESIEGLTNAIIESNKEKFEIRVSEPTPVKVKLIDNLSEKDKKERKFPKVEYKVDNEKNEVKFKITNDMVKQLAKEKMSAGVDRSKIKSIITSLAGTDASIIDLDQSNLEECYDKINELQPENK